MHAPSQRLALTAARLKGLEQDLGLSGDDYSASATILHVSWQIAALHRYSIRDRTRHNLRLLHPCKHPLQHGEPHPSTIPVHPSCSLPHRSSTGYQGELCLTILQARVWYHPDSSPRPLTMSQHASFSGAWQARSPGYDASLHVICKLIANLGSADPNLRYATTTLGCLSHGCLSGSRR